MTDKKHAAVVNNYHNCTFVQGDYSVTQTDNRKYINKTVTNNSFPERAIELAGSLLPVNPFKLLK